MSRVDIAFYVSIVGWVLFIGYLVFSYSFKRCWKCRRLRLRKSMMVWTRNMTETSWKCKEESCNTL